MLRQGLATFAALALATQAGCYNTYNITLDELGKVQEGGSASAVTVTTAETEQIVVTENTKIGVTDKDGTYHPISPFNFTMTTNQLVAPDEGEILMREQIETGNVKQISGLKTGLLVAAGVAALGALGVFVIVSAPKNEGFR
jgi:hypothetical protein